MLSLKGALRTVALAAWVLIPTGAVAVETAYASKKLAPPRPGAWKAVSETGGQTIGHFTVTKKLDFTGFTMSVPEQEHEEFDDTYCRGGTLSIQAGSAYQLPISHFVAPSGPFEPGAFNGWMVGASTGSFGGDSLQPAETVVFLSGVEVLDGRKRTFHDRETNSDIEIVLTSHKGKRKGFIEYRGDECIADFLVKRG